MKLKLKIVIFGLCFFIFQAKGQLSPQDAAKGMVRGINIGNTMEPPVEGSWGNHPVTGHAFKDYKKAGFNAIRIPITWDLHTAKTFPYTIDEAWLRHVEQVVDDGLSNQLYIIINAHHEGWIKESYTADNVQRFVSIWKQISTRLKGKSDHLLFEILNEPHPMSLANINSLNKEVLQVIRAANPTRIVIFSGHSYSNSVELLAVDVPNTADKYLLGNYHSYDPYPFGLVGTGTYGSDADKYKTITKFNEVAAWSVNNNIPVILGEFGYMKKCDYNSRMCAYATAVEQSLSHGIPFFAWDDNGDFQIYNRATGGFNEIKDILLYTCKESPTNMMIRSLSDSIVKIQWTNRTTKNDSIVVERKTDSCDFKFLARISPSANEFTDLSTSSGKSFYYRLKANLNDSIEIQSYPVMIILPIKQIASGKTK